MKIILSSSLLILACLLSSSEFNSTPAQTSVQSIVFETDLYSMRCSATQPCQQYGYVCVNKVCVAN